MANPASGCGAIRHVRTNFILRLSCTARATIQGITSWMNKAELSGLDASESGATHVRV